MCLRACLKCRMPSLSLRLDTPPILCRQSSYMEKHHIATRTDVPSHLHIHANRHGLSDIHVRCNNLGFGSPSPLLSIIGSIASTMQSVLPYTTNPDRMVGCERMKLINPNSASMTGPYVNLHEPKLVIGGLLHKWDADAAGSFLAAPKLVQTWNLSWTEDEAHWEENVHRCVCPEEVEDLLPSKWIGYRLQSDVDETLARVCKLCTALVDRFVALSQGDNASVSTAKWRQHQALYDRLGAVMELLEASIGEAVPILKLRDPEFIRNCWGQLQDEERMEIMSALGNTETEQ